MIEFIIVDSQMIEFDANASMDIPVGDDAILNSLCQTKNTTSAINHESNQLGTQEILVETQNIEVIG